MSGRFSRPFSGRSGVKKSGGGKKKTQVRQSWDNSIQDLGVHRATPEEVAHRHEIHKSKNHSLAQWELKKKSLKKEWTRSNGGTPDPLQERRLALMMEILSDQYQMKDVLERSDRTMAVVKDLFGDAPRRHTGFPHVTMAPSCDLETSRGPIAQKKDPPTRLSVLSESIMDPQALNEVEETQDSDDDDDVDVSISFQPGLRTDRVRRILDEESSRLTSEQWSRSGNKALNLENPLVTPKGGGPPPDGQYALNATAAVNKVKTRRTQEEPEEPDTSSVIGRVLNPQPANHRRIPSKGKKKRPAQVSGSRSADPASSSTYELSRCSQSSLDVLNQMIQEVERELETYERETGREAPSMPQSQGLTGFTLSLVSSIRRLVSYLKESDRQQRQESLERQRLKDELSEQRLLIDALTAEILSIKDGRSLSPADPHLLSDQSQSPGGATTGLVMISPEQTIGPANSNSDHVSGPAGLQSVEEHGDSAAPHPGYDASSITQMTTFGEMASPLDFQPAIMLSPPRQTTRPDFRDQSSSFLSSHDFSSSSSKDVPAPALRPDPAAQRWELPPRAQSLPSHPHCPQGDIPGDRPHTEGGGINPTVTEDNDIVSRMAELTCQNNALKAQLKQLNYKSGRASDGEDASPAENKEAPSIRSPATLEMRIAELNRQSTEARDKLLRLIEQQKQSLVVSPAISPITPQQEGSGRRVQIIDAVLPMPQFTDSSIEETPSPGSGRRSSASQRSNPSVSGSSRGGRSMSDVQRLKVGKDREEGWFALSTHVS